MDRPALWTTRNARAANDRRAKSARVAAFPPELYGDILRGGPKTQVPTKQPGPFRKAQANAWETSRLNKQEKGEQRRDHVLL